MSQPPTRIGPPKLRPRRPPTGVDVLLVLAASAAILLGTAGLGIFLAQPLRALVEGGKISY